jgi:hypothetical protein
MERSREVSLDLDRDNSLHASGWGGGRTAGITPCHSVPHPLPSQKLRWGKSCYRSSQLLVVVDEDYFVCLRGVYYVPGSSVAGHRSRRCPSRPLSGYQSLEHAIRQRTLAPHPHPSCPNDSSMIYLDGRTASRGTTVEVLTPMQFRELNGPGRLS